MWVQNKTFGVNMKEGDLITGVDRSYTRSIYKLIKKDPLELEFVSFDGYSLPKGAHETFKPNRKLLGLDFKACPVDETTCYGVPILGEKITLDDYRLATKQEIFDSAKRGDIPIKQF